MKTAGLAYTVRRYKRSKHVRVGVRGDGTVQVSAPYRVSKVFIDAFVRKHEKWLRQQLEKLALRRESPLGTWSREAYLEHKEAARKIAHERAAHFAKAYGVSYGRIAIRNQHSRWGSCSAEGNLNFNYKIALLPQHLTDYIIVHELCHLLELNHSPRFWALVAQTIPDHQAHRRELQQLAHAGH